MSRIEQLFVEIIAQAFREGALDKLTAQALIDYGLYKPEPEDDLTAQQVDEAMSTDSIKFGGEYVITNGKIRKVKKGENNV